MKKSLTSLVLVSALSLSLFACNGVTANKPDQVVYAAQGTYNVAVAIAIQYKNLPDCSLKTTAICSDRIKVAQLQTVDNEAYKALVAAQSVVRISNFGFNAETAALAAEKAVELFNSLTKTLRIK